MNYVDYLIYPLELFSQFQASFFSSFLGKQYWTSSFLCLQLHPDAKLRINVKIKVWEGICSLKVDELIVFCTLIAISHFDLQGHSHKFRDYYAPLGKYVLSNLLTMNIKHNIIFVSTKMVSSHTLYIKETKETWIFYSYIFFSFFHSYCNRETELS